MCKFKFHCYDYLAFFKQRAISLDLDAAFSCAIFLLEIFQSCHLCLDLKFHQLSFLIPILMHHYIHEIGGG